MEDALKFRFNFKHVHNLAHRGLLFPTKTAQLQPQQITAKCPKQKNSSITITDPAR